MEKRNNKENLERYPGGGGMRMGERSRLESINSCELEVRPCASCYAVV